MKRYFILYFLMTLTLPVITSSTLASHSAEYDIPITQYRLKYDIIHSKSHESISSVDSLDRQLYPGGYAKFNSTVDTIYSSISSSTEVLNDLIPHCNVFFRNYNYCDTITFIRRWTKWFDEDFRYYIVDDTIYYASYVLSNPESNKSPLVKHREKRLVVPKGDKRAFLSENNLEDERQLQFLYYASVWSPDSILSMAKDNIGVLYNSICLSRIIVRNDTIRSIDSIEMLDLYGMSYGFTTSTLPKRGTSLMYPLPAFDLQAPDIQQLPQQIQSQRGR